MCVNAIIVAENTKLNTAKELIPQTVQSRQRENNKGAF